MFDVFVDRAPCHSSSPSRGPRDQYARGIAAAPGPADQPAISMGGRDCAASDRRVATIKMQTNRDEHRELDRMSRRELGPLGRFFESGAASTRNARRAATPLIGEKRFV